MIQMSLQVIERENVEGLKPGSKKTTMSNPQPATCIVSYIK